MLTLTAPNSIKQLHLSKATELRRQATVFKVLTFNNLVHFILSNQQFPLWKFQSV
jgi:hypothetical protein